MRQQITQTVSLWRFYIGMNINVGVKESRGGSNSRFDRGEKERVGKGERGVRRDTLREDGGSVRLW